LYIHYEIMTRSYPGWTLTEQKKLSHREREYWLAMIKWRSMAKTQADG